MSDLLAQPANLSMASKYTVMNGYVYLAAGALLIVWPGAVQTLLLPLVLVPLAIAGIFPHTLGAFAILDPVLGIGAWLLHNRETRLR
ncbi:hypothetical protein [Variovorax sp. J22R115]|uniref:hypothetical protein n=1 Tax=Variovorax sp. J22R115 TaxID=3053509 RepID=UPI0025766036|nr:hypothetical protein [Variovorax sp. J22R115]MDM0053424.1 hypothetical protein [Variovorax sp. J22R115]